LTSNGTAWGTQALPGALTSFNSRTGPAITLTAADVAAVLPGEGSVGSYVTAQYQVAGAPVFGTSYSASTLHNLQTGASLGLSGTWQFLGASVKYTAAACCVPATYAVGLFTRVS
jgi:hypothetical protein